MMTPDDLRAAAGRVLARLTETADKLRSRERADIDSAIHDHSHLPDGYWKARHEAAALQAAARGVFDALRAEDGDEK